MAVSGDCLHPHPDGVVVEVWVVPSASRAGVDGIHSGLLKVRVTEPPEGGRASAAAARTVAAFFGPRRGSVVSGGSSRRKRVVLEKVTIDEARRCLGSLPGLPPG